MAMNRGDIARGLLQGVLSRGTLRIAVLPSLPPYSRVLPTGEPEGYDIDIAKKLAEALKVKPEFVVTDIPGRVTSLQTRKVDVTIADFTRNVERSTTIAFQPLPRHHHAPAGAGRAQGQGHPRPLQHPGRRNERAARRPGN